MILRVTNLCNEFHLVIKITFFNLLNIIPSLQNPLHDCSVLKRSFLNKNQLYSSSGGFMVAFEHLGSQQLLVT